MNREQTSAPHEELRNHITCVREEFATYFKVEGAMKSAPKFALVTFIQYEMMEERISLWLKILKDDRHHQGRNMLKLKATKYFKIRNIERGC